MFNFIHKDIDFAHKLDKPTSPSEEYFKHIHCFHEILYLVHGDVEYTVETETRQLKGGDLVVIPAGKFHFATVNPNVPYERYVLKFPVEIVPDYVADVLKPKGYFYSEGNKYDVNFNLLDMYVTQYTENEVYTLFICEVLKLIVMLCHEPARPWKKHDDFVAELIDYIDTNIQKPISIQTLTDEFHYSKSFINIEFKRRMHVPVMQYVRTKKAIAAHEMIQNGAKKSDVATLFGFETYSTFYRTYKKLSKFNIDGASDE